MNSIQIGNIIKYHRKKSGLSREELAKISGVGKTAVFDIENGKETVRFSTLIKILNTLNIKVSLDSPLMKLYNRESNEKS